jgi:hypothetical protein
VGAFDHKYRGQERPVAELAAKQHGVVGRWQLLELGFTAREIEWRVRGGRLHIVHRGVYAVGHCRLTLRGRWMAAVLACGPGAVLSHRAAAALWGIRPAPDGQIDVTIPGRSKHSRPGIRVHRVRTFDPLDRRILDGIPVTSLARTLLDYAEVSSAQYLRLAIEGAERNGVYNGLEVDELLVRTRGRVAVTAVRQVLAEIKGPAPWTQSEFENAALAVIWAHGIPEPVTNVIVEGELVDLYWRDQRLVVELDGHETHKLRSRFEDDRRKDTKLQLAGLRVMHVTQPRLQDQPEGFVSDLLGLLAWAA